MALPDKTRYESDSESSTSGEENITAHLLANEHELLDSDSEIPCINYQNCSIDIEKHNQQNDAHGSSSTIGQDCKSIVGSPPDRIPSLLANYKTPHSQRRTTQQQKKKQQEETNTGTSFLSNGNDQRQIPEVIKKWPGCVEVWLNMLYKEEATLRTRNARNSSTTTISPLLPRMRAILVDWIMEVCEVYQLRRNTYYLTLDYIDRFLIHRPSIPKAQLQLLGVTCLFIASKLEEIYPPKLSEFAYVCDGACTETEILKCELLVLHALGWDVNPMTPTTWLNLYMQIDCVPSNVPEQLAQLKGFPTTSAAKFSPTNIEIYFPAYSSYKFVRASQIIDLFSLDPGYSRFSYSVIAAAAMQLVSGESAAQAASGLTLDHIEVCLANMSFFRKVLCNANNPRLLSVQGNGSGGSCSTGIPASAVFMQTGELCSPAAHFANTVDKNQVASYRAIRVALPNLIRDENHTMQTHCIDLEYYERAVVLRLEWLGFKVKKLYSKQYKQKSSATAPAESTSNNPCVCCKSPESAGENSNCSCGTVEDDQERGENEDGESDDDDETPSNFPTVVMYELERLSHIGDDGDLFCTENVGSIKADVADKTDETDVNITATEDSNIFALQMSEKRLVNFDAILCSVHRYCTDKMLLSLWRQSYNP